MPIDPELLFKTRMIELKDKLDDFGRDVTGNKDKFFVVSLFKLSAELYARTASTHGWRKVYAAWTEGY